MLTEYAPVSRPMRRVTLELSLKPFFDDLPETRVRVAEQLFRQWMPLCYRAEEISIMLWIGDGSEILEFTGDLERNFEWGYWLGSVNHIQGGLGQKKAESDKDQQGLGFHGDELDPEGKGLHRRPYRYRESVPQFNYVWLKALIHDLKTLGERLTGRRITVGLTFDPGPEFAVSDFKYRRHKELCPQGPSGGISRAFIQCTARLHADAESYAAFPHGIPEGTSIGAFLGAQLAALRREVPFDFLWLSNGFGFGTQTWNYRGLLFDGHRFSAEPACSQAEATLGFWQDLASACPGLPLRTRGTNLTTGVDLASDAVPLAQIYRIPGMEAPVNSPWAALDGDFGLELAGWMSHIAHIPAEDFTYRFYAHDPWWMNSPWPDRYERRAHDIYLPLCVARLDESGTVKPPDNFNVLSADNSVGELPDAVAAEVSGHVLRTRELAPDALPNFLWIYPWEENHARTFGENPNLQAVYGGDWFVRGLVNQGVPINTVATTENFLAAFQADCGRFSDTILVAPFPAIGSPLYRSLLDYGLTFSRVLLYGLPPDGGGELAELLGLVPADPLEGDFDLHLSENAGEFFRDQPFALKVRHSSPFAGGPLRYRFDGNTPNRTQLAWIGEGEDSRALAVAASDDVWHSGATLGWLAGTTSCDGRQEGGLLPAGLDMSAYAPIEALTRAVLAEMGTTIRLEYEAGNRAPRFTMARSGNASVLAAFNPDGARVTLKTPHGSPLPLGTRVQVDAAGAHFEPGPAILAECRVFVEQAERGIVYVQELPSIMANVRRRWLVKGLKNARVRFFVEPGCGKVEFLVDPVFPYLTGDFRPQFVYTNTVGNCHEVANISGELLISW